MHLHCSVVMGCVNNTEKVQGVLGLGPKSVQHQWWDGAWHLGRTDTKDLQHAMALYVLYTAVHVC